MTRMATAAVAAALLVAGCGTIPEEQCKEVDWYAQGVTDGRAGHTDAETYAAVYDMRTRIADTLMPPFGTNEILSDQELRDVVQCPVLLGRDRPGVGPLADIDGLLAPGGVPIVTSRSDGMQVQRHAKQPRLDRDPYSRP